MKYGLACQKRDQFQKQDLNNVYPVLGRRPLVFGEWIKYDGLGQWLFIHVTDDIDNLVQDCSDSSALAIESLQSLG